MLLAYLISYFLVEAVTVVICLLFAVSTLTITRKSKSQYHLQRFRRSWRFVHYSARACFELKSSCV